MKRKTTYRTMQSRDLFFEEDKTRDAMHGMGNPLEQVQEMIDFEMFRPMLEEALENKNRKNNAGRKPFDPVLMFKILFLQRYYGLADHNTQYQILDRLSFRDFLGIQTASDVPDEKTVWKYREALTKTGTYDKLFEQFSAYMAGKGLVFTEGKIIDASFVEAPRQRNTRDENKQIKEGKGEDLWKDNEHKKRHKDVDARWTKKRDEVHYGYKNHAKVDRKTKMIDKYHTTPASVHDTGGIDPLLEEKDRGQDMYLDAGYVGDTVRDAVKAVGMTPVVCEKGYRNRPLTDEQKANNRRKSKVRCRVEHVFGFMEGAMGGLVVRSIGLERAKANVALTSLVYNVCRFIQIRRYHSDWLVQEAL